MWAVAIPLLVPLSSATLSDSSQCPVDTPVPADCTLSQSIKEAVHPLVPCFIKQTFTSNQVIDRLADWWGPLQDEDSEELDRNKVMAIKGLEEAVYYSYCCHNFPPEQVDGLGNIFVGNAQKVQREVRKKKGIEYGLTGQGTFIHFIYPGRTNTAFGRFYVNPGRDDSCRWDIFKEILSMNHEGLVSVKTVDQRDRRNDVIVGYTHARKHSDDIVNYLRGQFANKEYGAGCPDSKARVPPLIQTDGQWPQIGAADNPKGGQSLGNKFSHFIAVAMVNLPIPKGDVVTVDDTTLEDVSVMVAKQIAQRHEDPCNPF